MKHDEKEIKNNETCWKREEKQLTMMKKREQTMKHDEKERKNNEQWWKKEGKPMNNDEK